MRSRLKLEAHAGSPHPTCHWATTWVIAVVGADPRAELGARVLAGTAAASPPGARTHARGGVAEGSLVPPTPTAPRRVVRGGVSPPYRPTPASPLRPPRRRQRITHGPTRNRHVDLTTGEPPWRIGQGAPCMSA